MNISYIKNKGVRIFNYNLSPVLVMLYTVILVCVSPKEKEILYYLLSFKTWIRSPERIV